MYITCPTHVLVHKQSTILSNDLIYVSSCFYTCVCVYALACMQVCTSARGGWGQPQVSFLRHFSKQSLSLARNSLIWLAGQTQPTDHMSASQLLGLQDLLPGLDFFTSSEDQTRVVRFIRQVLY